MHKPSIRSAVYFAARTIENHPELYEETKVETPSSFPPLEPTCTLAWIQFFRRVGSEPGYWHDKTLFHALQLPFEVNMYDSDDQFHERLREFEWSWTSDGQACAHALRAYMDKYL